MTSRGAFDGHADDGLRFHGDQDLADGLLDFAVNVRVTEPPGWLREVLVEALDGLARYPDARAAREAIARRHGVDPDEVLPTNGGAEAFTLVAQGLRPSSALVVHPQFTEPEAALRAAGVPVRRHILQAQAGFRLDPAAVLADLGSEGTACAGRGAVELVSVGNPTNPTGVLLSAEAIHALRAEGRVILVDEAFMDAVPHEPESVLGVGGGGAGGGGVRDGGANGGSSGRGSVGSDRGWRGLLVARSLTKTWGLAGLRAGYLVGDRDLIAACEAVQPPWSVSSLALAAMTATATADAVAQAQSASIELTAQRAYLMRRLDELGMHPVSGAAPFVLVEVGLGVRDELRRRGIAVRRGDTFPGLGPGWVRIAVRNAARVDALIDALSDVLRDDAMRWDDR